jgi:hypothetical protein
MIVEKGQTVKYKSKFSTIDQEGTIDEVTSLGYKINNTWYDKTDITIKQILLDSRQTNSSGLILG